ncbi:FAD:protein FMN transferase [Ethanoligenens sp.]|uniref:FAD:protein FMN transferase n=1 Tax=Ethanoligenens sp. TaxID=2099655 RepID=UPI0039EAB7AF
MAFYISWSGHTRDQSVERAVALQAHGDGAKEAMEAAAARVRDIDAHMSFFNAQSEVSAINRNAGHGDVCVSPDTFFVVKRALQYAEQTSGCLDITIAPVLRLWDEAGRTDTAPDNRALGKALRLVNYRDVLLGASSFRIRLNYEGQAIDLGSIAKGYAADEVRKILRARGVKSALIDLGGSAVALGARPDGKPWEVKLRCPGSNRPDKMFGSVEVIDRSVVTAGAGSRPVIDTKTGRPVDSGLRSVTVIAESALDADALAFTALLLGPEQGRKLVEDQGAEAVLVTTDGLLCVTDGLKPHFCLWDTRVLTNGE